MGLIWKSRFFEDDGTSTGLIFYVQLKATKAAKKAEKVSLTVDHLEYLNSLTLPTLIARYCEETDSFWVRWHYLKKLSQEEGGQQTVTFHFEDQDRWNDETARRLEQGMRQLKWVRGFRPQDRFPVRPIAIGLGAHERTLCVRFDASADQR